MRDAAAADLPEVMAGTGVSLNRASLAGLVMGLLYALPYLRAAPEVTGPVAVLAAAADLVRDMPPASGSDGGSRSPP